MCFSSSRPVGISERNGDPADDLLRNIHVVLIYETLSRDLAFSPHRTFFRLAFQCRADDGL